MILVTGWSGSKTSCSKCLRFLLFLIERGYELRCVSLHRPTAQNTHTLTQAYTHIHTHTIIVSFTYILLQTVSHGAQHYLVYTHRSSHSGVYPLCFWKHCTHHPSKLAHPVLPRRSGNVHHDGRPPLIDDNMLALWHENDRYSFEDSDRFEEDSLCTWSSEPESACINWRGWRKPTELNTEDG